MRVDEAIELILDGIDKKARKLFFPTKAWAAVYVRPYFPDFIDRKLLKVSKL